MVLAVAVVNNRLPVERDMMSKDLADYIEAQRRDDRQRVRQSV